MLQVVCVNVGKKWGPEHVYRLKRALQIHLPLPHDFAVITDRPELYKRAVHSESVRTLPAMDNLQGWWQKVTLFADRDYVSDRVMYLDLDCCIVGDLLPIALLGSPFVSINDRWQVPTTNTSFMLWDHADHRFIYDEFEGPGDYIGDQNYVTNKLGGNVFHVNDWKPEWVKSFKADLMHRDPIDDERIVYFHGVPHPKDVEWVQALWSKQSHV